MREKGVGVSGKWRVQQPCRWIVGYPCVLFFHFACCLALAMDETANRHVGKGMEKGIGVAANKELQLSLMRQSLS